MSEESVDNVICAPSCLNCPHGGCFVACRDLRRRVEGGPSRSSRLVGDGVSGNVASGDLLPLGLRCFDDGQAPPPRHVATLPPFASCVSLNAKTRREAIDDFPVQHDAKRRDILSLMSRTKCRQTWRSIDGTMKYSLRVRATGLAEVMTPTEFKAIFLRRTREAREGRGLTQAQAAALLGIPVENYKKYETRSQMPHDLVERFCLMTGVRIDDLFSAVEPARKRRQRANRA